MENTPHLRPYLLRYTVIFACTITIALLLDTLFSSDKLPGRMLIGGVLVCVTLVSHKFVSDQQRAFTGKEQHRMVGWSFAISMAITLMALATLYFRTGQLLLLDIFSDGSGQAITMTIVVICVFLGIHVSILYLGYGYIARMSLAHRRKKSRGTRDSS